MLFRRIIIGVEVILSLFFFFLTVKLMDNPGKVIDNLMLNTLPELHTTQEIIDAISNSKQKLYLINNYSFSDLYPIEITIPDGDYSLIKIVHKVYDLQKDINIEKDSKLLYTNFYFDNKCELMGFDDSILLPNCPEEFIKQEKSNNESIIDLYYAQTIEVNSKVTFLAILGKNTAELSGFKGMKCFIKGEKEELALFWDKNPEYTPNRIYIVGLFWFLCINVSIFLVAVFEVKAIFQIIDDIVESYPISEQLLVDENGLLTNKPLSFLHKDSNDSKIINIDDKVVEIGDKVFKGCHKILKIQFIGKQIRKIGESAFEGCVNIKNISIPPTVSIIGRCAFKNCKSLKHISLSNGLIEIGEACFASDSSLQSISLPRTIQRIHERAFSNCKSLSYVRICQGICEIKSSAFARCPSLKSLDYEGTVEQWSKIRLSKYSFENGVIINCTDGQVIHTCNKE